MNTTFRIECSYNKKNKVRNRTDTRVPVVKTLKKGVLSTGVFYILVLSVRRALRTGFWTFYYIWWWGNESSPVG